MSIWRVLEDVDKMCSFLRVHATVMKYARRLGIVVTISTNCVIVRD